jgi:hypothetical protein
MTVTTVMMFMIVGKKQLVAEACEGGCQKALFGAYLELEGTSKI